MGLKRKITPNRPTILPLYPFILTENSPLITPPISSPIKQSPKFVKHRYKFSAEVKGSCQKLLWTRVENNVVTQSPSLPGSYQRDTQVLVQFSNRRVLPQQSQFDVLKSPVPNSKMFIGRVYDNHKKNKNSNNNEDKAVDGNFTENEKSVDGKEVNKDKNRTFRKKFNKKNSSTHDNVIESDSDSKPKKLKKKDGDKSFVERINEKVKVLKKDKEENKSKINGVYPDEEIKQVVYSISRNDDDVELGDVDDDMGRNYHLKNLDKFDTIELNNVDDIQAYNNDRDSHAPQNYVKVKNSSSNQTGFNSIGIQASPYPPFRLRVLPEPDWRESETKLLTVLRLVFCQVGLASIVFTWALFGAFMFYFTEGPQEYKQALELSKQQTSLIIGLATDLRNVVPEKPVWRETIERYTAHHESLILAAVSSGYPQKGTIWTYPGCLLFSTSLLTTLGFGAPVPRTVVGRICAIVFAGLGIPVHFLLILNLGLLCAVKLHHYARVGQKKVKRLQNKIKRAHSREKPKWPEEIFTPETLPPPPSWLKLFPFFAIPVYYMTGLLLFGIARGKDFPEMFLFPLDFTAAGGVASTYGPVRIAYAMYLEGAVILASTNVALLRVSATRGFTSLALKLGLMTNSSR